MTQHDKTVRNIVGILNTKPAQNNLKFASMINITTVEYPKTDTPRSGQLSTTDKSPGTE